MELIIKQKDDFIEVGGSFIFLYGQAGVRKSSFAFTAKNALMFDFDNGVHRVDEQYRGQYVPSTYLKDWTAVYEALSSGKFAQYDTFVFDSITMLMEYMSLHVQQQNAKNKKAGGGLTIQGYGVMLEQSKNFVNLLEMTGKDVVFVGHEREFKEGDETRLRPDVLGSSLNVITRKADMIGYMEIVNGQSVVQFTPTSRFVAKNSAGLEPSIKTSDMSLDDIILTYKESINKNAKVVKEYKALMNEFVPMVEKSETAKDLNDILSEMNRQNEAGRPIKTTLSFLTDFMQEMRDYAEQIECVYDKEKKCFVSKNPPIEEVAKEETSEKKKQAPKLKDTEKPKANEKPKADAKPKK